MTHHSKIESQQQQQLRVVMQLEQTRSLVPTEVVPGAKDHPTVFSIAIKEEMAVNRLLFFFLLVLSFSIIGRYHMKYQRKLKSTFIKMVLVDLPYQLNTYVSSMKGQHYEPLSLRSG